MYDGVEFSPWERFTRWGLDADLNHKRWNLGLQYLRGRDENVSVDYESPGHDPMTFGFSGGFAELSYSPTASLVAFARYDRVRELGCGPTQWTLGARRYLRDDVALHVEYSRSKWEDGGLDVHSECSVFAAKLDFAF